MGRMLIAVPATVLTPGASDAGASEYRGTHPDIKEVHAGGPEQYQGPVTDTIRSSRSWRGSLSTRGIPFHSIIGDRGQGDGEQGSDGVVPYKSAHLEGAESELIVPSDHAATAHPFTVLEVKRILKLHLQQAGLPRS